MIDRMPPLAEAAMNEAQKKAAAALIAGPRKAVVGPFIPLMRSPELLDRVQRVGEYLRFQSSIPGKLNEFAMLVIARHATNQFEWAVHHPLAIKAGIARETVDALAEGRRPAAMAADEALIFDFVTELLRHNGVSDASFAQLKAAHGEQGVMDLVGLVGYFLGLCFVMNVAHTPPPPGDVAALQPLPR